jgi:acetate kinase
MAEPRKHEKYDALIYACHALAPVRTAVVHPCDETSLAGASEAANAKIKASRPSLRSSPYLSGSRPRASGRYGFHGLSYEYILAKLADMAPGLLNGKLIVAHLGNGASMCALDQGRSVVTTMGFTTVDGLPMGPRTGTLDPGVILYLLQHEGMDSTSIERLIYEESGLGVSGLSSDMRTLLASVAPAAKEAVSLFIYRIGRELGSLVAALQGLDALVFTGGIGKPAAEIRARVCQEARWIGISLDEQANAQNGPLISCAGSPVGCGLCRLMRI